MYDENTEVFGCRVITTSYPVLIKRKCQKELLIPDIQQGEVARSPSSLYLT